MSTRQQKKDLVAELISEFRVAGNQDSAFDNLAADRLGLNRTDLHCINIIENSGGLTAGRLAAESGLTTGAVIWGPMASDWAARLSERFTAEELEQALDFLRSTNEISRKHLERLRKLN